MNALTVARVLRENPTVWMYEQEHLARAFAAAFRADGRLADDLSVKHFFTLAGVGHLNP